ncbi:MAG: beta-N-acetylglucosaminidase domain-containing protein [Bacteroidaceae bacterium]|nr:beta-N-acetylglucosaminidase domain-containing protein [Bacteroidaceae bacterium]
MRRKLLAGLFALLSAGICAQGFTFPTPVFQEYTPTDGMSASTKIVQGVRGDKAVRSYASRIPAVAGGYLIVATPKKIVVAGHDADGLFYGLKSLEAMRGAEGVPCGIVRDWPAMPERGIIEGFYGNPYSHAERLRLFDFMGAQKMNVYVYGPKDDPYHRTHWRVPYPTDEAARITELAEAARRNHVQFVWAIHPGLDIRWNRSDSLAALGKLQAMYDIGVRAFCVFFDDIGGEGTRAEKQADLLNFLTEEFVRKHADVAPLMMCPTQYNKAWSGGDYLRTLGTRMDKSVRIMWTGNTVVDMITREDMEWINKQIGRKAYIWLNYPVTDYCIDHLLMGPTYGNGLDIADMVSGFCSNPMEYCKASKVSLFSIADYAWNTAAYDSIASWERAMRYLVPEPLHEAFRTFCENNVDLGPTGHGLRRYGESPEWVDGEPADLQAYFNKIGDSARRLLWAKDQAPEMVGEIEPWLKAQAAVCVRGLCILDMRQALATADSVKFINAYEQYVQTGEIARQLRSRDFPGSIKTAAPVVATLHVEPWLRSEAKRLEKAYRSRFAYRLDVFPVQAVPDGTYYIKANGRYLTDLTPSTPGARAVFTAERDTINPQRQEWTVELSPATGRYSLVCNQARRYLNEVGRFGTNPYSELWNTYELTPQPGGGFTIRNAQNAGTAYWRAEPDGDGLTFSKEGGTVFEIIKVE